jgi:hypothetical protein
MSPDAVKVSQPINILLSNICTIMQHLDKIKIIKYLKVLQHISDHRGAIIREPCTVHG